MNAALQKLTCNQDNLLKHTIDQHRGEGDGVKDKPMTFEKVVEGKGTVRVYGTLDLEGLIKRLASSKSLSRVG